MKNGVYLLLGSNLGNREENLLRAIHSIALIGSIKTVSSIYKTQAWGNTQQADFLNQVIEIDFEKSPTQLLEEILVIEKDMGRVRLKRWGPRIIDIDILFFGNTILSEPDLQIPHPQIQMRKFTLLPLVEIAPEVIHPLLKKSITELLKECTDPSDVKLFKP